MSIPSHVVDRLASAAKDPEEQKVILALLLQPPRSQKKLRFYQWQGPPLLSGSNPGKCNAAQKSGGNGAR